MAIPNVVTASDFSGATVGAQIDAACASLNGAAGLIVIPPMMGSDNSVAGIPNGCQVVDLRGTGGPDAWGTPGGGFVD